MKLYRQSLIDGEQTSELTLVDEHESIDHLKALARRLAQSDGCTDIMWLSGSDTNPQMDFPLELEVDGRYRLLIRQE